MYELSCWIINIINRVHVDSTNQPEALFFASYIIDVHLSIASKSRGVGYNGY